MPTLAHDLGGPLTASTSRCRRSPARSSAGGGLGIPRLRFLSGMMSACAAASPSITLGAKSMAS